MNSPKTFGSIYVYTSVYIYMCMYVCMYACMHGWMEDGWMDRCMYVCMYVRTYVCTYVRMYVWLRMHVCTSTYYAYHIYNIYIYTYIEYTYSYGSSHWIPQSLDAKQAKHVWSQSVGSPHARSPSAPVIRLEVGASLFLTSAAERRLSSGDVVKVEDLPGKFWWFLLDNPQEMWEKADLDLLKLIQLRKMVISSYCNSW